MKLQPFTVDQLRSCCGSSRWVDRMRAAQPFADRDALLAAADELWRDLAPGDWLEAFACHPRIGDRSAGGEAAREQAGVVRASAEVLAGLVEGNHAYQARFGHVFLICATGKTADEMLAELRVRLGNEPDRELAIAAEEQRKITRLRLQKLLDS
jgi:OHCU decarboxylase